MTRVFPTVMMVFALRSLALAAGEPPSAPTAAGLPEPRPPSEPTAWQQVKELDQVVVERAPSSVDKQPWSRGSATIAAPLPKVVAHVLDFSNLPRFVPKIKEARILEQKDDVAYVYYRLDLPWPLSDRHWVCAYRWQLVDGRFTMSWTDANQRMPADAKSAVVVELVRGTWELWADGDAATKGRLVQIISLGGGWMPKSVIDQTVWKQPLETFRGMRKALGGPR